MLQMQILWQVNLLNHHGQYVHCRCHKGKEGESGEGGVVSCLPSFIAIILVPEEWHDLLNFQFYFLTIVILCQCCKNCNVVKGGLKIEEVLKVTDNCCHKNYIFKKWKQGKMNDWNCEGRDKTGAARNYSWGARWGCVITFWIPVKKAEDTKPVPSYCIKSNWCSWEK